MPGRNFAFSWNHKKPDRPKGKHQKAQETKHKITESIEKWLMAGKDIPFHFEQHLTVSGDGTAVHTHACPNGHHRDGVSDNLRHFPDPDAAWG